MKRRIVRAGCVLGVVVLCACASIVATQTFEISTDVVTPDIPRIPTPEPRAVTLTARFGSCSRTALGSLEKLRESKYVDSADVFIQIRDVSLHADTSFAGIQSLTLELLTPDETITICDRSLSEDEQQGRTIECEFEHRLRAEELCMMLGDDVSGVAEMNIELLVSTGEVTLNTLSATLVADTELEADVSL